ncbi:hypothetical protein [Streptomyces sp. NRRL F-5555]|uniref:hypothetical protein n=1 Tax=Streptomyces sp. NRRL F-5555 TaxID=1463863 RepID=UPI00068E12B7|nr:hypothetical protein [Streptomyces sp. NRRL F-5555]
MAGAGVVAVDGTTLDVADTAANTPVGGRGTNAIRVLSGIMAGIVVGAAGARFPGDDALSLGAAVLGALFVALLIDGERIMMAQAAVGAVISVASGQQAGIDGVLDALLGAGVALVFSQLLFPPHPLALLRRAETATLEGLGRTLDEPEEARDTPLSEELRPVYTLRAEHGTTPIAVARRTGLWRGRREPVVQEIATTKYLDLLGNSCHTLIRGVEVLDVRHRQSLAQTVRGLSGVLTILSTALANRSARLHATRRTLDMPGALRRWTEVRLSRSPCGKARDLWPGTSWSSRAPTCTRPSTLCTNVSLSVPPRLPWPPRPRRVRRPWV